MNGTILERIRAGDNLPSLPTVAVEILRLMRDDNTGASALAAVIQQDPALTGRILKMVNSSLFGLAREVSSPTQAVNMLGMRTVKVMALSFSLVGAVRASETAGMDYSAFWRRSVSSAVTARLLARAVARELAEDAFVCGLLSDLGMMAAWRCAPDEYGRVLSLAAEGGRHITEIEIECLDLTHARLSSVLLEAWGLPARLCHAVAAHHGEGLDTVRGPGATLGRITYCSALIAELFCGELDAAQLDEIKACCRRQLGITPESLEMVLKSLNNHIEEQARLLALQFDQTIDYTRLQLEAAQHLASLTVEAEVERVASIAQFQQAQQALAAANQERAAAVAAATIDALTGIANRAAFDRRLQQELTSGAAAARPLALIMVDVDHFKRFNDLHGHQAGDAVLRSVGQCLARAAGQDGFAARFGGEEFCVITRLASLGQARALAERLRTSIAATTVSHAEQTLSVTASFGVAWMSSAGSVSDRDLLIETADRCLYEAKRKGRDRVESTVVLCESARRASTPAATCGVMACGSAVLP